MWFEESSFLVEKQLVELRRNLSTTTFQSQSVRDITEESRNTAIPGWIAKREASGVQFPAFPNICVDKSLLPFAKWALRALLNYSSSILL